jgi:predicted membrane protein (TIGR00267 family)
MASRIEEDEFGYDAGKEATIIERLQNELKVTHRMEIVKRHIAIDVFDGVLPVLGIITGGFIAIHFQEIFIVFEATLLAAFGAGIAHFIAGFGATYLTESAEGEHLVKEMESDGGVKLSHSHILRAERETTLFVSLVNGMTPALSILITILPMILALFGIMGYWESFVASIFMGFILLFVLGIYLGRMSGSSVMKYAAKTLLAGFLTILILLAVSFLTGLDPIM